MDIDCFVQPVQLCDHTRTGDGEGQPQLCRGSPLPGQCTAQYQNICINAVFPELCALQNLGHCQHFNAPVLDQRLGDGLEAQTVGVGLEHGDDRLVPPGESLYIFVEYIHIHIQCGGIEREIQIIICFPFDSQKLYTIFMLIATPICEIHKNRITHYGKISLHFA